MHGGGLRIRAAVHARVLAEMRQEYEAHVGRIGDEMRSYTRAELVTLYKANLSFWRARVPSIDADNPATLTEELLARHAICTNAEAKLLQKICELGLERDVV